MIVAVLVGVFNYPTRPIMYVHDGIREQNLCLLIGHTLLYHIWKIRCNISIFTYVEQNRFHSTVPCIWLLLLLLSQPDTSWHFAQPYQA